MINNKVIDSFRGNGTFHRLLHYFRRQFMLFRDFHVCCQPVAADQWRVANVTGMYTMCEDLLTESTNEATVIDQVAYETSQ